MLSDIGREIRKMVSEMLDAMEPALEEMDISYHKDTGSGMIIVCPKAAGGNFRRIEIQPFPLCRSVEVRAFRTGTDNICRCRFRWIRDCRKELSKALRKVISGG